VGNENRFLVDTHLKELEQRDCGRHYIRRIDARPNDTVVYEVPGSGSINPRGHPHGHQGEIHLKMLRRQPTQQIEIVDIVILDPG